MTPSTRHFRSLMKGKKVKSTSLILLVVCLFLGCGVFRRADPNHQEPAVQSASSRSQASTESNAKVTGFDAGLLAKQMIDDCLSWAWVRAYKSSQGKKPVVTVAIIQNSTGSNIDTKAFKARLQRELSLSDQVSFVASHISSSQSEETNVDPPPYNSRETINRIRSETGADFVLVGGMDPPDQIDADDMVCCQIRLEMINTQTLAKVWGDSQKIHKQQP